MAKTAFISLYDEFALGIRYLSSVLKAGGHETRLVFLKQVTHNRDLGNLKTDSGYSGETAACSEQEYQFVRDIIREFGADFIGLSFASQCYGLACWLSARFKSDFPDTVLIWGGVDPTLHPELGIDHCDFLAVGESEESLPELLEALSAGRDPSGIEGFWGHANGATFRNPTRALVQNLDTLPFPDFQKGEKYLVQDNRVDPIKDAFYLIMTQRGCPYRCSYCANAVLSDLYPKQKHLRRRGVDHVMRELHWIRGLYPEIDYIAFYDDIFTLNKKWLREFAPRYRDEVGLPFWCYTYPGQFDEESARLLKDMGVEHVQIGIQSGSERTLREVYHRSDPARIEDAAAIVEKHQIPVRYDLIAGNPMEDDEDRLATLDVLLKLPHPFRINPANPLCFYINSPITRLAKERGIALRQLDGVNGYHPAQETHYLFWKALYNLTQYPTLDRRFIRSLAGDAHLKAHPEILESFQAALEESYWTGPGGFAHSTACAGDFQSRLRALAAERDQLRSRLDSIEGKWLYRFYKKVKRLFFGTE